MRDRAQPAPAAAVTVPVTTDRLSIGLRTLLLGALLLFLGLMSVAWNVVALLLYPILPETWGRTIGRSVIAYCYQLFWNLAVFSGMLRLDSRALVPLRDEPGLIVVANHPSMMDALLLVARLPRSACIMKADLMRNVLLGPGARLARYIRNDSARGMVREAVRDLKRGGQLVVFPEGTRTTRHPVNPFRHGVTLIARLAGAPIQTVFIDTDSPYLGKGWPIWRLPPLPIVFRVRLGERFAPSPDPRAQLRQLEDYFAGNVKPPGPGSA